MELNLNLNIDKDKIFYKTIAAITIPIALQNIISYGVNLMDTVMLGKLGEVALSATSLANQVFFMFTLLIFGIGGGIKNDKEFKAVQMGGPSGGCIPASLIDTPVDYENITKTGAIVGSGGMIVMDETTCMVDMARYFLDFTRKESCGKCNYCRIGTKRMLEILERITKGEGKDGDIELLEELAYKVKDGAMCGLGQTAPNPVLTTLKYFRNEYEDHIYNKKCTAKSCKSLISFNINEDCRGCGACAKKCPVGAISGNKKEMHTINQDVCIRCGRCEETCKFDAIVRD